MIDWDKPVRMNDTKEAVELITTKGRGNFPVLFYIGGEEDPSRATLAGKDSNRVFLENYTPAPFWYEGMLVDVAKHTEQPRVTVSLQYVNDDGNAVDVIGGIWGFWKRHPDTPWHPMSDPMPSDKRLMITTDRGECFMATPAEATFLYRSIAWRLPETHTFHTGDV